MSRRNEGTGEVLLYKGIEGHICEVSKTSILKICCELIFILFVYINTIFCVFCVFSITIYSVICVYTMCNIQNNFEYNVYICSVSLVCLCAVRFELEKTQNTFWRKNFVCSVCLPQRVEKWATLKGTLFLLRPAPTLIQSGANLVCVCVRPNT